MVDLGISYFLEANLAETNGFGFGQKRIVYARKLLFRKVFFDRVVLFFHK